MKPSKIFSHYLKGTFFIDFLASVPSDLLMEAFVSDSGSSRPFF
jgi:hypothetical protein